MSEIRVRRGRTTKLQVQLAYDVSQDTITSQIRRGKTRSSPLIATWLVTFRTDGKDGKLDFILDDSVTNLITANQGYMDIKRITGGEPVDVLENPLLVTFTSAITA